MCRCACPGGTTARRGWCCPRCRSRSSRSPSWLDVSRPDGGPGVELADGYGWPYAAIGAGLRRLLRRGAPTTTGARRSAGRWAGWALFWGLDGLAQSYVAYGIHARRRACRRGERWHSGSSTGSAALLPLTVAVLLFIFPTGRFLAGRWGRAGQLTCADDARRGLPVIVAPADERAATSPSPRRRPRPGAPSRCRAFTFAAVRPGARWCSPSSASWSRWRRSSSATGGPAASSGTGCAGCCGRSWSWR